MKTIGEKIKELRKARDMTQDELASCLGVAYQTVSKWETGVTSPDLSLIVPIARLFKVTTDELFCFSESADEQRRAELKRLYDGTFRTGDLNQRLTISEQAVKEFPGDMAWLNRYAWDVWCSAVTLTDEQAYLAARERAVACFRKVIETCRDDEVKAGAVMGIVQCLKEKDPAEAMRYAALYPETKIDPDQREELLISCMTGEERLRRHQRHLLNKWASFLLAFDLFRPQERQAARDILRLLFPDGRYCTYFYDLYRIALTDAREHIGRGELDEAVRYMKEARGCAEQYDAIEAAGAYGYTAPLFNLIKGNTADQAKTGTTTLLQDFIALFAFPAYAPLKTHPEYAALTRP